MITYTMTIELDDRKVTLGGRSAEELDAFLHTPIVSMLHLSGIAGAEHVFIPRERIKIISWVADTEIIPDGNPS